MPMPFNRWDHVFLFTVASFCGLKRRNAHLSRKLVAIFFLGGGGVLNENRP